MGNKWQLGFLWNTNEDHDGNKDKTAAYSLKLAEIIEGPRQRCTCER